MAREDIKYMSDEEINIAIAKACGYEFQGDPPHAPNESVKPPKGPLIRFDKLPNYCNDPNAMYEAEQGLFKTDPDSFEDYTISLMNLRQNQPCTYHASARQRAELFLKVLVKNENS